MKSVAIFVICVSLWGSLNLALAAPTNSNAPISPNLKLVAVADGKSFFADYTIARNWTEAKSYCEDMGMTFAAITSQAQADALNASYSDDFNKHFWTSGRDAHERRQFTWNSTGGAISEDYPIIRNRTDYPFETCLVYISIPGSSYMDWWHCDSERGALCTV